MNVSELRLDQVKVGIKNQSRYTIAFCWNLHCYTRFYNLQTTTICISIIWQLWNLSYVDGWAINIWLVYIFISWNTNILKQKHVICWRLSRQHNRSFWKVQTCHMLTAQPSTYHMFGLIELYGRKLQSVCPKKCGDKLPSHCMQGEEDWSKHFTLSIVLSFNLCIQSFLAFHLFSRWISYDFSRKFGACFQWDITLLCLNFGCIWVDIWHTNFTIPRYVFPGT